MTVIAMTTNDAIRITFYGTSGETVVMLKASIPGGSVLDKIAYRLDLPPTVRFERVKGLEVDALGVSRYGT
jgi:hypothetical protein